MAFDNLTKLFNNSRSEDCPICGNAIMRNHRPFCSNRCKQLDLVRWLSGSYSIPSVESSDFFDNEEIIEVIQPGGNVED